MDELEDVRREMWGRMTAAHLVDGALAACERQPARDQECLMREIARWPAPGSADTELGVLMEPEVSHGETEVYTRVQA